MNKKLTGFLLLSASMLLASCGASNAVSSSVSSVEPSIASSSESSEVSVEPTKVELLYQKLENKRAILSTTDFYKISTYGGKAMYYQYIGDYAYMGEGGYLINGEQGLYEYTVDDSGVHLGDIVYRTTNEDFILSSFYTPYELSSMDPDVWVEQEDGSYTTDDESTLDLMCHLAGNGNTYGSDCTNVKMTIADNYDVTFYAFVDLSGYEGYGHDYDFEVNFTITEVGTAHNDVVEAYLANPTEGVGLSEGYTQTALDLMNTYSGEALPAFEWSKFSYAFEYEGTASIGDLGVGCKVDEYSALLAEAGWEIDDNYTMRFSGMDAEGNYLDWEEGDEDWYYQKAFSKTVYREDSTTEMSVEYVIYVTYSSSEYYNDVYYTNDYTDLYPDGVFGLSLSKTEFHTFKEFQADWLKITFGDNQRLPTVAFSSQPINIVFNNNDAYWQSYYGGSVNRTYYGWFTDAATALAQLKLFEKRILSSGYNTNTATAMGMSLDTSYGGYDGFCAYDLPVTDDAYMEIQLGYAGNEFVINVIL